MASFIGTIPDSESGGWPTVCGFCRGWVRSPSLIFPAARAGESPINLRPSHSLQSEILPCSDNRCVIRPACPMRFLKRVAPSSVRCPRRSDGSLAMACVGAFSALRHSNNFRAPAGTVEEARAHVQHRHVGRPEKMSARRHLKYYLKVYSIVTKHSNGFPHVLKGKRLAFGIRMRVFPK
jgi:hypothetical protein